MTAQEYADMVTNGNAPWMEGKHISQWSDSSKEQYFNFLNTELANEMELDRWRLNNEYNTPYNQMKRLIEAGINPAAAYQNVNSGNSSQAPDTHQPGTAAFHDTQDKLARINTIMNGISSIMSTIENGVGAVAGIQDISQSYRNDFFNRMVYNKWHNMQPTLTDSPKGWENPVQVAPGVWSSAEQIATFPQYFQSLGFSGGSYENQKTSLSNQSRGIDIQEDLKNRRTRIDNLIQSIMEGLESNADNEVMLKYFMQLFMYGAMSKFGGF